MAKVNIQNLTCSCCGGYAPGRQWYNRDTGYGVCLKCVESNIRHGEDADSIKQSYGVRGVHYDPTYKEPTTT